MSSRSQRPFGRRSAVTVFYFLALGSGVMRTLSVGFDIVALNTSDVDPIVYGVLSQWVSFVITFSLVIVLSIKIKTGEKKRPIGFRLDPDFGRFRLLPKKPMVYLIIGGVFAGIATFSYYLIAGAKDASTVLPYGQLVIIYLLLGDLMAEKDTPTIIEMQCIVSIMFGVILVGVEPGGFDLVTLFIVLVPMNISSAFMTYFQRITKRMEISPGLNVDSLNMRVWSLLVLNTMMTLLSIPYTPVNIIELFTVYFAPLLIPMIGSSVATFLALVMYVRALGRGSMAVVNSLSSISVVLGIPMTLIGNLLIPGAFGIVTADGFLWALKIFGVILVMIGVIALEAADVRALVLIKVKPGTGDILPELFDIKGVEQASAIAGTMDYMLSIKSRSLKKTRTNILQKVQMIPQVDSVETLVIMKEYR